MSNPTTHTGTSKSSTDPHVVRLSAETEPRGAMTGTGHDASVPRRLRDQVTGELAAASAALGTHGRGLRDGVHRARKAIRRARAALRLGWRDPGAGVALALSELKRLNDALSDLRDMQVLVDVADRLLLHADDDECDALRQARKALAARRRKCERDPRTQATVDDVAAELAFFRGGIDGLPWDVVAVDSIDAGLEATRAAIARARNKAFPDGDAQDWHRWRRRLRRLSQQCRACRDIGLDVEEDLFGKSLAEQLGVLHDLNLMLERGPREAKQAARRARDKQRERLSSLLRLVDG